MVHREYDLASIVTKSPVVTCVLSEEIELYIFRVILRAKHFYKISKVSYFRCKIQVLHNNYDIVRL